MAVGVQYFQRTLAGGMGLTLLRKSLSPQAKKDAARGALEPLAAAPVRCVVCSYQQNGNTLAILQPNDRVASVSARFRDFGDGAAVATAFGVSWSSLVGDAPF